MVWAQIPEEKLLTDAVVFLGGAVPLSKGSKNCGEIPELGVSNFCHPLEVTLCPHSASPGAVTAVWSHRDMNSTQHCPFALEVPFNGPKSSWLRSLRSFVHWQVGKGRVSLFRYCPFLFPLSNKCVGFKNRLAVKAWMKFSHCWRGKVFFWVCCTAPAQKIGT